MFLSIQRQWYISKSDESISYQGTQWELWAKIVHKLFLWLYWLKMPPIIIILRFFKNLCIFKAKRKFVFINLRLWGKSTIIWWFLVTFWVLDNIYRQFPLRSFNDQSPRHWWTQKSGFCIWNDLVQCFMHHFVRLVT